MKFNHGSTIIPEIATLNQNSNPTQHATADGTSKAHFKQHSQKENTIFHMNS